MDWEATVLTESAGLDAEDLEGLTGNEVVDLLKAQAEKTWLVAEEKRLSDQEYAYGIGFRDGRRSLIEWLRLFHLIDPTDPTQYTSFRMEWHRWQTLLKELEG